MADERRALDQLLAALDGRLGALLGPFARNLATLVRRAPKDGGGTVSAAGRLGIGRWLDGAVAALFGAFPGDVEVMYSQPGTFPHLIAGATNAAARAAVTPAIEEVARRLAGQPSLMAALARPQGARTPTLDPTRSWVDPNGHRLSDRIWQSGREVRARIDAVLDYGIRSGASAADIATALEDFLTAEGKFKRVLERQPDGTMQTVRKPITTRTPYGTSGLANPRRLARTEVTRAYGSATIEAGRSNPFVTGIRWRLSAAHPESDVCDERAAADPHGLGAGIYRAGEVPTYPDHPQCLCTLVPVVASDGEAQARIRAILAGGGDRLPLDAAAIADAVSGFPLAAD